MADHRPAGDARISGAPQSAEACGGNGWACGVVVHSGYLADANSAALGLLRFTGARVGIRPGRAGRAFNYFLSCWAAGAAGPAWVYRFLGTTPMQWIGRLSYSWYLWHWPVLVFSHFLYGPLSLRQSVLVCLLSFLLAAITHAAVENPIRVSPFLGQRAKLSFAMGFIVTLLSAGTSWWVRAMGIQLASASNQVRFQQAHEEVPRVYGD